MLTKNFAIIALLSITILTGCQTTQTEQAPTQNIPTSITSANVDRIVGMQWILKEMTVEGKEYELTGEKPFIKIDDDGKISGFAGVNRFFGSADIDDEGTVTFPSAFGSTRMAGPPEQMKLENAFLATLEKINS